jgi:hypothetical protein
MREQEVGPLALLLQVVENWDGISRQPQSSALA